jgi:hypothetical protein
MRLLDPVDPIAEGCIPRPSRTVPWSPLERSLEINSGQEGTKNHIATMEKHWDWPQLQLQALEEKQRQKDSGGERLPGLEEIWDGGDEQHGRGNEMQK